MQSSFLGFNLLSCCNLGKGALPLAGILGKCKPTGTIPQRVRRRPPHTQGVRRLRSDRGADLRSPGRRRPLVPIHARHGVCWSSAQP